MSPEPPLDHPEIDVQRMVDRYLTGRLSSDEEARFEEHLFDCTTCLEQVEAGDGLQRGLRTVAAEEAANARADAARVALSTGVWGWLGRRSPAARSALLGLALALVLAPAGFFTWKTSLLPGTSAPGGTPGPFVTTPSANLPIVPLGVERSAGATGQPAELRHDPEQPVVLLSLDLPPGRAQAYHVTLYAPGGDVHWRARDLTPNVYGTLIVALPTGDLPPGLYRVEVEATDRPGEPGRGLETAFRVLPPR